MTVKNTITAFKAPGHSFNEHQMSLLIAIVTHENVFSTPAASVDIANLLGVTPKKVQARLAYLHNRKLIVVKVRVGCLFCSSTEVGRKVIQEACYVG